MGYVYTAYVKLEMEFYGASGKQVAAPEVSASKKHQLGGAQVAAFRAIATEEGTELNFGQSPRAERKFRPIVRPGEVSSIDFGTPEYDQTLLGMVTDDVLLQVVIKLRDHVGPDFTLPSEIAAQKQEEERRRSALRASSGPITGTIIHVDAENQKKRLYQCRFRDGRPSTAAVNRFCEGGSVDGSGFRGCNRLYPRGSGES